LTPKYRRHKPTGQAVVRIGGRDARPGLVQRGEDRRVLSGGRVL
jgi:hypothetical protein